MRRQTHTSTQNVRSIARSVAQPVMRQAFLVNQYTGYATAVAVTFTDPRTGTRGIVVKAAVSPGIVLPTIDAGTPVSVVVRHGRVEIIGLSSSSVSSGGGGSGSGLTNPMTTPGDLILGGAAGAAGRLAVGTDGLFMVVDPSTHLPLWTAHDATGNPHSQYALTSALAAYATIASTAAYPSIVDTGTLTVAKLAKPGTASASVTRRTGLTYRPWVMGWYTLDSRSIPIPDVITNAAGQVLDTVHLAVAVVSTDQTQVTATMTTTRPNGRAALTFRWYLLARSAQ